MEVCGEASAPQHRQHAKRLRSDYSRLRNSRDPSSEPTAGPRQEIRARGERLRSEHDRPRPITHVMDPITEPWDPDGRRAEDEHPRRPATVMGAAVSSRTRRSDYARSGPDYGRIPRDYVRSGCSQSGADDAHRRVRNGWPLAGRNTASQSAATADRPARRMVGRRVGGQQRGVRPTTRVVDAITPLRHRLRT